MNQAICHDILSRARASDFGPTLLSDFTLDAGRPVALDSLRDPVWSLYGLDMAAEQALFVELPPGLDLSTAAFLPVLQFAKAVRLIRVGLDDLPAVAALMPKPEQLILVFSMGRCGSTLASKILTLVPGVRSLSEPGPFLTLALDRFRIAPARQRALVTALTQLMFRPLAASDRVLALKFHSQVLFQADHFFAAFPRASYVFQYRDGLTWASSFSRFMQMVGFPMMLQGDDLALSWMMTTASAPIAELSALFDISQPLHHEDILAPGWARHIQEYQRLRALGVPFFPLRYDALNSDPHGSARALLTHCNLPLPDATAFESVLAQDSQQGTQIARTSSATGFSPDNFARFRANLLRVAPDMDPNTVL